MFYCRLTKTLLEMTNWKISRIQNRHASISGSFSLEVCFPLVSGLGPTSDSLLVPPENLPIDEMAGA